MTSGADGQRLFLNERHVDVAVAIAGPGIGCCSWSAGVAGNWSVVDLYQMVVYDAALPNAVALAVAQALITAQDIVPVTSRLILEGDSII